MIPKSLIVSKPSFRYELATMPPQKPTTVEAGDKITLMLPQEMGLKSGGMLKIGTTVKTGQLLNSGNSADTAVLSTTTGTISDLAPHTGDYGRTYMAITVSPSKKDDWVPFEEKAPDIVTLARHFETAPGGAALSRLIRYREKIETIIIYGGDTDLLVETSLHILKNRTDAVNRGIALLKQATGIDNVILAVPSESFQNFDGHFEADVIAVPNTYPGGQPLMIYCRRFGRRLEQGQSFESAGVWFVRTEAVAAMGRAVMEGRIPVEKIVTVLDKQGRKRLVSARIGTPVADILKQLHIFLSDSDRLIFGGPMTGTAIYAESQPILPDTDAIMVQDRNDIVLSSDYPCINCGDCVRICPANVQVNILVRFLEAGQYQEGADLYDLYSCVECGLCSFVCVSRIPILQYIKLAKHELARLTPAEEENEQP
jgi:Na+-translocating ferredoxin:NAD+ oxidoreductase subunit C